MRSFRSPLAALLLAAVFASPLAAEVREVRLGVKGAT
jgi:hypothetical protein